MLLQSVIIDPADIGHRMSGPVILVVRVFTAKAPPISEAYRS